MSFILDALKKSESDRQRQSGPSLFEVKIAPPRRRLPVWAVAIAALLAINVIVISWMLLRHPAAQQPPAAISAESQPAPVPARHAIAQEAAPAPAPAAVPPSASGPAASMTNAAPQPPAPPPSSSQPITGAPSAGATRQSAGEEAADGDPGDTAPAVEPSGVRGSGQAQGSGDDLPLYQQVVGSAGLPELHLDLHVFAARPQDRFVMINMHRLGEGDTLPNGVQVDAIRPDGVALSYHGTHFLLPRN